MSLRRFFAGLGPGMIMAATAIGTSHIVLAPVAGARFGFDLLWLILFAHVFKYPAFEFGALHWLCPLNSPKLESLGGFQVGSFQLSRWPCCSVRRRSAGVIHAQVR